MWNVCGLTPLFEARTSVDRMNDQRTSYAAEDKHSLVQQICVWTAITFTVRKSLTHIPSPIGSYGRLADGQTKYRRILIFLNSLQVKLFRFFLHLISVQCYYSVNNVFQSAFLK